MRKAVMYARVSSKEQEREGFSIPAQLKLLREYARSKSFAITAEFVDVESAGKSGRENFGVMLAALKKERDPVILVEKTDRLYRNLKDYVTIEDLGIEVHMVREGKIFSKATKCDDKFIHGIHVLMARRFLDNLREETQKGMREKAEQGIYPSTAPRGYRNITLPDGRRIVSPDPDRAREIMQLFDDYATGKYSLRSLPRPSWAYPQHLKKIFDSPFYYGEFTWKGKRYQGLHEPLVSKELWERCQAVMRGHSRRSRTPRRAFPFSGLIHCGHCGFMLIGRIHKGRYIYYHCKGSFDACPEPYVRQETLEEAFTAEVMRLRFTDEFITELRRIMIESAKGQKTFQADATKKLRQEYDRLQKRLEAAYVDRLDDRIDLEMFSRFSEEWRTRQDAIQAELAALESAGRTYVDEGIQLLEICQNAVEVFGVQPALEKRKMLDLLGLNFSWKAQTLEMQWRRPFDMLLDAPLSKIASLSLQRLNSIAESLIHPDEATIQVYEALAA